MPPRRSSTLSNNSSGFTLVELMVVLVIIAVLASLTLAGLAGARHRAKVEKTKSTIRKIHEILIPQYQSLATRRVPLPPGLTESGALAQERLRRIRTLTLAQMPDHWEDVAISGTTVIGSFLSGTSIPDYAWNGITRSYGEYHQRLRMSGTSYLTDYPSSECLYMIASLGCQEPDAMEVFRADEIGDKDNDGAPEFHDGWGQPIMFVRWPIAFVSPIQTADTRLQPDPFDPMRVSNSLPYPNSNLAQRDYAVTPLIASAGPDFEYGITTGTSVWSLTIPLLTTIRLETGTTAPGFATANAADNVTNHGL
jgi:prepilin-type N-terminal cleavage/methylation domain-containing protein